jgi:UDP-2,3-diacylglucosamine hydrolase
MSPGKIYFLSDFHLGAPDYDSSRKREERIVRFLKTALNDATELYLLGDIFDFWFEYRSVVPKGYVRLMGVLAEFSDRGIPIYFFGGNHDYWTYGYLAQEFNMEVHKKSIVREIQGKKVFIGHGDGLGPGEYDYKVMKVILNSKLFKWIFRFAHPDLGLGIANYFSRRSRKANMKKDQQFLGEKEYLLQYCKKQLAQEHFDLFIFGHRHLPLDIPLEGSSRYVNIGDWIKYNSYGVMENGSFRLETFND